MEFRFASDGIPFDRKDVFGREALVPSWLSEDKQSLFLIHTGANSAGDGGDGHFAGSVVNQDTAVFEPFNVSHAGNHAGACLGGCRPGTPPRGCSRAFVEIYINPAIGRPDARKRGADLPDDISPNPV